MNQEENVKTCNKCNVAKSLTEFHKAKKSNDGLRHSCKECIKQYDKTRSVKRAEDCKNNKNGIVERNKEYHITHKNEIKEFKQAHKGEINERRRIS